MDETVHYEWTEELGKSALRAYYTAKVARIWLLVGGGTIISASGWWLYLSSSDSRGLFCGVLGLIFLTIPLRVYLVHRTVVKDLSRFMTSPRVTLNFKSDSLHIQSGTDSRTIEWKKLTEAIESKGFLLLSCGRLIVASLPLKYLSDDQIRFIKSQIPGSKSH